MAVGRADFFEVVPYSYPAREHMVRAACTHYPAPVSTGTVTGCTHCFPAGTAALWEGSVEVESGWFFEAAPATQHTRGVRHPDMQTGDETEQSWGGNGAGIQR